MHFKRLLIIVLLLAIVAAGAIIIKIKKKELSSTPPPSRPPLPVRVATVKFSTFPCSNKYLGTIRAKVSSLISARTTAHIVDVTVREGNVVKKGQLLASLDNQKEKDRVQGLRAEVAAAKTAFSTQEAIYQRDKMLFRARAISKEALERSKSARDAARGRLLNLEKTLASAIADLDYTMIRAPFTGVVTKRLMDPGDLALPGRPIVAMEAPSKGYYVEIEVPQEKLSQIPVGSPVLLARAVNTENTTKNSTITCTVSRLHPAVSPGGLAVIEADVQKRPFSMPTGSTLEATIETGKVKGFLVPVRALLENVRQDHVFSVTSKGTIHIVNVETLYKNSEVAVVDSDQLSEKTTVVVAQESGLLRLHEGQKVLIVEADNGY